MPFYFLLFTSIVSLRILHLEDSELDAELVQAYLLDGGFDAEIVRVDTREEFSAEIERGGIDLILADYNLPSFDGLAALEIARAKYANIPFIIISGALGEETAIETLKSGATDYILKHRLERLVPAVSRALREAEDRGRARRAENALRESEERYRIVAETASDAIISIDIQSNILFINSAAEKIFGYKVEEMTGQSLLMLMPENLRKSHREGIHRYLETGERRLSWDRVEVYGVRKNGEEFPLELSFGEFNQNGEHIFIGIARDVTERKVAETERESLLEREQEARRKAEEASRLKDEFLATVSHELRTPLNAILGWATMLRSGQLNQENTVQAVEIIERNARAQVQLVEDLLDVSRIISGKLRLEADFIDFKQIVENAIEAVQPAAEAKLIKIETDFQSINNKIFGDTNRLQQVIWNLLTNAVKFTPSGGNIKIALSNENECLEFKVTDTGEGISPEFLPFVFDRFRQADGATTRIHSGLGLGLSIVKHLIEMHGGEVSAKSEGVGHGSTFSFCLPQQRVAFNERAGGENGKAKLPPQNNHHSEQIENPLAGLSVLAVDDDEDSREMLQLILEQNGASVVTAGSAAEALEKLKQTKTDVLVSDIGMPLEDGYSLVERLRKLPAENGGEIPAVALTGFAREEDNRRALVAGFNKHVAKPIDPENLVREIAELMKEFN